MLRNYLATGIGLDYLLALVKFKNLNKQIHQAASNLLQDEIHKSLSQINTLDLSNTDGE